MNGREHEGDGDQAPSPTYISNRPTRSPALRVLIAVLQLVAAGVALLLVFLAASGGLRIRTPMERYRAEFDRVAEAATRLEITNYRETGAHLCYLQCPEWTVTATLSFVDGEDASCDYLDEMMTQLYGDDIERNGEGTNYECTFSAISAASDSLVLLSLRRSGDAGLVRVTIRAPYRPSAAANKAQPTQPSPPGRLIDGTERYSPASKRREVGLDCSRTGSRLDRCRLQSR